jgi:hypothetical protein
MDAFLPSLSIGEVDRAGTARRRLFHGFGDHCGRVNAPAGVIRFLNDAIIRDPGELDAYAPEAPQLDVRETPPHWPEPDRTGGAVPVMFLSGRYSVNICSGVYRSHKRD